MANRYTIASGLWSAVATWDGGIAVPADGDAVVITGEHEVVMDVDLSAWTGLLQVTISGHATTPAELIFKDGTSGHLKIRTAYNLVGTTVTNKGRLLANSDGVWGNTGVLAFADKAVIDLQGTSQLIATNLDIALYCAQPTKWYARTYKSLKDVSSVATATDVITMGAAHGWAANTPVMVRSTVGLPAPLVADTIYYVVSPSGADLKLALTSGGTAIDLTSEGSGTIQIYDGHTDTATAEINVLDDVTGDAAWVTTDGHDRVVLVDAGPETYDQQRLQLTTILAGSITLSANVDSVQYPGARIYLSSRNVSIRSAGNVAGQPIVNAATSCVFQCEIINTAGSGVTFYGYGLNGSNNNTISGTISGCNSGLYNSNNNTVSGTISGCSYGLYVSHNNTVSGTISGCSYGLVSSNNNTISGTISGCNQGLNSSNNNTISGTISGCTYGLSSSNNNTISGTISGCNSGLSSSNNNTISGTISGCTYGFSGSLNNTLFGTMSGNAYDLRYYGITIFRNANTVAALSLYGRNTAYSFGRVRCENLARVNGAHKIFDCFGDIIKTACNGTGDAPSADPDGGNGDCVEASNIQSNCNQVNKLAVIEEQRIWRAAALTTLTYKVQTNYAGISAGNLKLTVKYIGTDGAITEITNAPAINQRATAADWTQTLAVTFTPTQAGWVTIMIELMEYANGNEVYIWPAPVIS